MRWIRFGFLVLILLMVGCTTVAVTMKLDPSLANHAQVYELSSPGKFSDARLNVAFGDYRVAQADTGWMRTRDPSAPDPFWLSLIIGVAHLSTSSDPDANKREEFASHTYQFKIGNDTSWDAECHFRGEKADLKNDAIIQRVGEEDKRITKTLSSYYRCQYTALDHEPWVLTVEWRRGHPETDIKMTNNDQHFEAHVTAGEYVAADGRNMWGEPAETGYTWTRDNESICAISVGEKPPRVWLHKDNSKPTNDVLSMGSAGLFIYHNEIVPTLKRR